MAEQWEELFEVDEEQRKNIQTHGFYTALIKPGLRILSINSLHGYILNPVAFLSLIDGERKAHNGLIVKTLSDAKANSEKVILLSHLKPNHLNAHGFYTRSLESIVAEFHDTIILMVFGHEHADTFTLSTDPSNRNKVTGAFLAAPSITPFIGTNPSYRVFKLDAATFQPLDYDQFYVDLQKANDEGTITVKKHYSFTEEYNVPDLSTNSFKDIADRIVKNWDDFQKFERNRNVLAPNVFKKKCWKLNPLCRRSLTCETVAPTISRYAGCLLGLKL